MNNYDIVHEGTRGHTEYFLERYSVLDLQCPVIHNDHRSSADDQQLMDTLSVASRNFVDNVCKHQVLVAYLCSYSLPGHVLSQANIVATKRLSNTLGIGHFFRSEQHTRSHFLSHAVSGDAVEFLPVLVASPSVIEKS